MAYDAHRGVIVLYGGESPDGGLHDTWEYDGSAWRQVPTEHVPNATMRSAVAYDAARREVVLFGGYSPVEGPRTDETWTYDGTDWTRRDPPTSPPGDWYVSMVYDSHRQVLVGFFQGGTWEWDGQTWTKRETLTVPPDRGAYSMGYDPYRQVVVLAAGNGPGGMLGDTWEYDGTNWHQAQPLEDVVACDRTSGAFMDAQRMFVLFCGYVQDGDVKVYVSETWRYWFR